MVRQNSQCDLSEWVPVRPQVTIFPLLLCCDASCVFIRPHNKHSHSSALTHSPGLSTKLTHPQKSSTTHNSGLFHLTMGSCGRCCRHPSKSPGRELNYSGAFLSACKNHQIFKKRPDAVICSFCEGRCFIFTHRPSKGQRLSLARLAALI